MWGVILDVYQWFGGFWATGVGSCGMLAGRCVGAYAWCYSFVSTCLRSSSAPPPPPYREVDDDGSRESKTPSLRDMMA